MRVDRVLADGAGRLGHEAGEREDERVADRIDGMRATGTGQAHRRAAAGASSSSRVMAGISSGGTPS